MSSQKTGSKKSLNASSQSKENIQAQLKAFYDSAKEKLLKMKSEVEMSQKEYEAQKVRNEKKNIEYQEALIKNKELDVKIKGLNEKILSTNKVKASLQSEIKDIQTEMKTSKQDLDYLQISTDYKVSAVKNAEGHIKKTTENQVVTIQERILKEKEMNDLLKDNIKNAEEQIKALKSKIEEVHSVEGKKSNALLKDTADMTKFLAEL